MTTPQLQRLLHSGSRGGFWLHQQRTWAGWEGDQPAGDVGGAQRYPWCHRVRQVRAEQAKPPAEHNLPALGATGRNASVAQLLTLCTQPARRLRALPGQLGGRWCSWSGRCGVPPGWAAGRGAAAPRLQPAAEHTPVGKHSGWQGRPGLESTFGRHSKREHSPGQAPAVRLPLGTQRGFLQQTASQTARRLVLVTPLLSTHGGRRLAQQHKFHTTSNGLRICRKYLFPRILAFWLLCELTTNCGQQEQALIYFIWKRMTRC